ncbi:MAG: DNA-3-methyladenine glycosylase [Myxococcota bacterium]|nr:DNA-3-methyladenine glycosylase [Myxococcota bacterium]
MNPGRRLSREFFERPCLEVAPELIGKWFLHRLPSGARVGGRLVEVEAYLGDGSDPAAHSHRGPTPRNQTLFGPAGRLYVYQSYGIHICVNAVCEAAGSGTAVLLRALEPVTEPRPNAAMRRLRGLPDAASPLEIARGPGRLGQAMSFELAHDGANLQRGAIGLYEGPSGSEAPTVAAGPRVGLTKATALPYRYYDATSRFVSAFRSGKARKRG